MIFDKKKKRGFDVQRLHHASELIIHDGGYCYCPMDRMIGRIRITMMIDAKNWGI